MKKKIKPISIFAGLLILIGFLFALRLYNKPHINISKSKAHTSIAAITLVNEFSADETASNTKYLDHIIEVTGKIAQIKTNQGNPMVALGSGKLFGNVICYLLSEEASSFQNLNIGDTISIKGICTGYLMDVTLINAVITYKAQ